MFYRVFFHDQKMLKAGKGGHINPIKTRLYVFYKVMVEAVVQGALEKAVLRSFEKKFKRKHLQRSLFFIKRDSSWIKNT